MGIWNTITKLTYEFISASTVQNFKNMQKKNLLSNEEMKRYKDLNEELKKVKEAHSEYISAENEKDKQIKKANSNAELSEEEKEKIIEEAEKNFEQFEDQFFARGGGSKYGDKISMREYMNEISQEILQIIKSNEE